MYRRQDFILTLVACFTLPAACPVARAQPLGTAFTYQGQLKDGGSHASGAHHMTFALHSHATLNAPVGSPIALTDVPVTEGLFTVELDFGSSAINGSERWLQIEINGEPLSPRQRIAATPYALQTRGIHVDSGGKVGIGTMTPQDRLTVNTNYGEYGFTHSANLAKLSTYVGGSPIGGWLGTQSLHPLYFFTGNSSAQMTLDTSGNLGIGTQSPQYPLTVRTNSNDYGISHMAGTITLCTYVGGTPVGGWLGTRSLHPLHFFTGNSSAQMTLHYNGRVGIGTPEPVRQLHVADTTRSVALFESSSDLGTWFDLRNTSEGGRYWRMISSGNGLPEGSGKLLIGHGTAENANINVLVCTSSGNVGIGTFSPTQRLHVVGNICATGTIGACSDARFKDHVEPVTGAMEKVEQLRGVNFDWKREEFPDHEFAEARQLGFIAQEVEKVLPQVVSRGEDGYLSVDYGRMTPLLVEAIKELRKDNQRLHTEKNRQLSEKAARIAELTQRLEKIEAILDKLNRADEGAQR